MKTTPVLRRSVTASTRKKSRRAIRRPTLYELFKDFDGLALDLPADFAANHDHYLYGSPKRLDR
jgi:hypothetical protein